MNPKRFCPLAIVMIISIVATTGWHTSVSTFVSADEIFSEADFSSWITTSTNKTAVLHGSIILTQPLPIITRPVQLFGATFANDDLYPGETSASSIICSSPNFTALIMTVSTSSEYFSMTNINWSGCGTVLAVQPVDTQDYEPGIRATSIIISGCTFEHNGMDSAVGGFISADHSTFFNLVCCFQLQ